MTMKLQIQQHCTGRAAGPINNLTIFDDLYFL